MRGGVNLNHRFNYKENILCYNYDVHEEKRNCLGFGKEKMTTMKRLCLTKNQSSFKARLGQRGLSLDFLHSFLDKPKRRNCV